MNAIVGQKKLVSILEKYTIHNVPKTILFLGPSGCGKSWVAARFAEQLNLPLVNLTKDTTAEDLVEYAQCPIEKLYVIDLKDIAEKQQSKFLKFIEEPSATMYIILTAESEIGVLSTILNRCTKFIFEAYTKEELQSLSWSIACEDEEIYNICKTPGQLLNLQTDSIPNIKNLCELILSFIKGANYANTLSIVTQISCKKDDYNKYDFDLFLNVLEYTAYNKYLSTNDKYSYDVYLYLIRQKSKLINKSVAKESFLLSFLDTLWRLAR